MMLGFLRVQSSGWEKPLGLESTAVKRGRRTGRSEDCGAVTLEKLRDWGSPACVSPVPHDFSASRGVEGKGSRRSRHQCQGQD